MHNPPREMMDGRIASQYEEFEKLKAEGIIREYGVSLDWREEAELVLDTSRSKALEIFFNALYQEPLPAFQKAQDHGAGIIVKVPLDSGWLAGRYRGNHQFSDIRKRWPPEVLARRSELVEQFAALVPEGMSMAHTALQFILAQPQVSTIIPGAKSVEQALDNFAAADKQLSAEVVQAIHDLWMREIQSDDPTPCQTCGGRWSRRGRAVQTRDGQLLGVVGEERIRHAEIAFGVFKVNRVDLLRHGGRTDFARYDGLFEISVADVTPDILGEVDQDGIR
jgi:diketogulonate reductase-like aldo/keto reductase